MANAVSTKRWQDQLVLVLGIWLFISPWVLSYASDTSPAWNAHIAGIIIAVIAALELYRTYFWAAVINLLAGLWTAISPWALGVASDSTYMTNALIVGIAVFALTLWEMISDPELSKHLPGTGAMS
ncbi:MAG: SPW repeat protein [Pseudomonadota bacterium]